MKTEHRHFVCAPNGHYAHCRNSRLKARWGAQATSLCSRSGGVMRNDEFFVAQPSWLWGRQASCLSKLRRRDACWPDSLEAYATFTL